MLTRLLDSVSKQDMSGHCEVHIDFTEEMLYIEYYGSNGEYLIREDFPGKDLDQVKRIAMDYCKWGRPDEHTNNL